MADEKPKSKKARAQDLLQQVAHEGWTLAEGLVQRLRGLSGQWRNNGDMVANNFELGLEHLRRGHVSDAVMRFKIVTWRQPANVEAWYYLGSSYLAAGEKAEAASALRKALHLRPDYEEAGYMLAIASDGDLPPERLPRRIPPVLAEHHFDSLAPGFTQEQLESYHYQGHVLLANAIRGQLLAGRIDHTVLDIGCGSGLLGPLLRDIASNITGVDISAAMLAEAMKVQDANGRKIYDALVHREIHELMPDIEDAVFDVVAAVGVFSYIGELRDLMPECARVLKRGGLLAFTADRMDGHGLRFDPADARFRFSKSYLQELAAGSGLKEVRFEEADTYPGEAAWLCVFAKP